MKKLNLKLAGVFAFSLLSISTFAQDWMVGGNNNGQLGGALQPRLGTNGNRPLLFETNGIARFKIMQGGTGIIRGRIGVGNNLPAGFTPWARLHLHQIGNTNAFTNRNTIKFTSNRTGNASNDGFEIAEVDLKLRGPGNIMGTQQSGVLNLKIADIVKDGEVLKTVRELAITILKEDMTLEMLKNERISKTYLQINKNQPFLISCLVDLNIFCILAHCKKRIKV